MWGRISIPICTAAALLASGTGTDLQAATRPIDCLAAPNASSPTSRACASTTASPPDRGRSRTPTSWGSRSHPPCWARARPPGRTSDESGAPVNRSITRGGAVWARLGFYFILTGTALWTVSLSLDVAVASAVANWLSAPSAGKDEAWIVVASLSALGRGMVPMTWIVYWLALALLNIAMIFSDVYPRWLGWTGLIVSIPVTAAGAIQVFVPRSITLTLIFSMLMLLTILWNLATGIWVARRAWS